MAPEAKTAIHGAAWMGKEEETSMILREDAAASAYLFSERVGSEAVSRLLLFSEWDKLANKWIVNPAPFHFIEKTARDIERKRGTQEQLVIRQGKPACYLLYVCDVLS